MEIHRGRFGWRRLPSLLLPAALCQHSHKQDASYHWGSKRSSILKKNRLLREILLDGTVDFIEMHNCYRKTWGQLFWTQNLKMPIFFFLNMLEIWKQIIFEAKWSKRDPAVLQPFCCVSNVALSKHSCHCNYAQPNTIFFNLIFWTLCSLLFQDISDFKMAIGQSHSAWQLLTRNAELKSCNMTYFTQDYR